MEAIWIITWLILCIILGSVGSNRKIGFWGAFFLSLLLSPLIGLIITLASKTREDEKYEKEILTIQKSQKQAIENLKIKDVGDIADDLLKIKNLLDNGVIDNKEYENLKSRIMKNIDFEEETVKESLVNPDFFIKDDDKEIFEPVEFTPNKDIIFVYEKDIIDFMNNHTFKSRMGYTLTTNNHDLTIISPKGRKLEFVEIDVLYGYKDKFARIKGQFKENGGEYIFSINPENNTITDYDENIYYAIN